MISFRQAGAVHPCGFKDLAGDFLEVGVEHPDDDRQVDQHQREDKADLGVEQPGSLEQQVHRDQHADGRHHLGRQHPHQRSLVRLPGTKAMAQAAGMAMARPKSVEPTEITTEFQKNRG